MLRKSISLVILLSIFMLAIGAHPTHAMANQRRAEVPSYGKVHYWQLKAWKDSAVLCELFIEHNDFPKTEDIETYCGTAALENWQATPACDSVLETGVAQTCDGSFLVDFGLRTLSYTKIVPLPRARALFEMDACQVGAWCDEKPVLRFYGLEPLSDYSIQAVHVQIGARHVTCSQTDCLFSVPATDSRGIWVDYWAVSSFGDESPHTSLHLRNVTRKIDGQTESMIEVLDPGSVTSPAASTWDAFPTAEHPDSALYEQPNQPETLTTSNHLYYLAGRLIFTGQVSAEGCPMNGLLDNGMANACGEEKAYPIASEWQNRYDLAIYQAAQINDVPARLLKGVIAQESQFWPDTELPYEYGIGSVSQNGVDMLLTVDEASFLGVCLPNFERSDCAAGYTNMTTKQRAYLRGLMLRTVHTQNEIDLLARILHASALQVGDMIHTITGEAAGEVSTYEDLWDLTIANYNGGSGCIEAGIKALFEGGQDITLQDFDLVNTDCPAAGLYVENVKNYAR